MDRPWLITGRQVMIRKRESEVDATGKHPSYIRIKIIFTVDVKNVTNGIFKVKAMDFRRSRKRIVNTN